MTIRIVYPGTKSVVKPPHWFLGELLDCPECGCGFKIMEDTPKVDMRALYQGVPVDGWATSLSASGPHPVYLVPCPQCPSIVAFWKDLQGPWWNRRWKTTLFATRLAEPAFDPTVAKPLPVTTM